MKLIFFMTFMITWLSSSICWCPSIRLQISLSTSFAEQSFGKHYRTCYVWRRTHDIVLHAYCVINKLQNKLPLFWLLQWWKRSVGNPSVSVLLVWSREKAASPQELARYDTTSSWELSRYKVNIYFITRKLSWRSSLLLIMILGKSCFFPIPF